MTYQEALQYLNRFVNLEKKDSYDYNLSCKLDRMRRLCSLLGDPQDAVRAIHVAGTKGKGSTSVMIQSILKNAGFKTGLYTSPHLASFRERIRIDDELISEGDLGSILDTIKAAVDECAGDEPSFFEIYTVLAYIHFKSENVDFAVYETGLGGRLDATNVVEPLVCAITSISFDHTGMLGDTLEKIAYEKAGIIKNDSICVSAPQEAEALSVIEKVCTEKNAELVLVGRDIKFNELSASDEGEVFNVTALFEKYDNLHMKMLGFHQVVNATVAIGVIEGLRLSGVSVGKSAVRRGIGSVTWPGRLEVVRKRSPRIILDGAQNKASADALARSVRKLFKYGKLILVLGVSKDKDIKGILKELVPISDTIILTKSEIAERAMDPAAIHGLITPKSKDVIITRDVKDAIDKAIQKAGPSDLVLVTGSLFVVGQARKILVKDQDYD
ncbi:MAG: bifunctional folylpolyglutamate synthase/dihydrofolate synthase [Candidatus Omnitrophica bacterium]|nr:bifunctional folylpolyglutamate synthase/dihydrofolate synthase [Candidatus Omnitrophota bacterium]